MYFDTVIHNGVIATMNPAFEFIESGIISIHNGKIAYLGMETPESPVPEANKKIDAKGCIVMPGLVNTHTHLPMTLFRGLADDIPLDLWLTEHIFPAEAKHIHPESVRWATLLACCEMLLSGTTTCCDGYFLEDHVAGAFQESFMRGILAQGIIDFPAPGVPDPHKNVDEAIKFVETWKQKSPLIRPSIFCHSPYTCSEKTLKNAKKAAMDTGVLFQVHVSETYRERQDCERQHGISPVRYLEKLGLLDKNTILVHAIWVDDADLEIIFKTGAGISHVPESNMKLASGIAPLPKMLKAGITTGIGTDGCASNNTLDLFTTMDICAKLHKVNTLDPTTVNARTVLEMATITGAKSIGLDDITGSLEIGKSADIIIIDIRKPHLTPIYSAVSHLVYSVNGSDVTDVLIAGKHLVKNRQITTLKTDEIIEQIKRLSTFIG
jgi:5-methylthioadenosine/S-adenosylhomocysteine deaminase